MTVKSRRYSLGKHVNKETNIHVPHRRYVYAYTYLFADIWNDSKEHIFYLALCLSKMC